MLKHLIRKWTKINLDINDSDWSNIQITEVRQQNTDSDIIYLKCTSTDEIAKITSKAYLLGKNNDENAPRIVQYVPYEVRDRYNALVNIMKAIRSDNVTKTNIRIGKTDYLVRTQLKLINVKWSEIPPRIISEKIPEFNVGILDINEENDKNTRETNNEIDNQMRKDIVKQMQSLQVAKESGKLNDITHEQTTYNNSDNVEMAESNVEMTESNKDWLDLSIN